MTLSLRHADTRDITDHIVDTRVAALLYLFRRYDAKALGHVDDRSGRAKRSHSF